MTETYKQLAQAVGTAEYLSVYSVPSNSSAVVSSTSVVNTGESGTYSIAAVPSSEYAGIVNSTPGGPISSQLGQAFVGQTSNQLLGQNVAISRDGNIIAIRNDEQGSSLKIYSWNGSQWVQRATLTPPFYAGISYARKFALSANGNFLIVSAPGAFYPEGRALLYKWNTASGGYYEIWNEIENDPPYEIFGDNVAISDSGLTFAVTAAGGSGGYYGAVYVYDLVGSVRTLRGGLPEVLTGLSQQNGTLSISLSADGNTVAYGSVTVGKGRIRTFDWNGTSWIERPMLTVNVGGFLGGGVKLSADGSILIATKVNPTPVSVLAWSWNGTSWQPRGNPIVGANVGIANSEAIAISSSGNRIIFGGGGGFSPPGTNSNMYIYDWNGTAWVQLHSSVSGSDGVGYSVGLSGDGSRLIFSRPYSDENASNNGSAYVNELTTANAVNELVPLNKHIIVKSKAINSGEHHEFTGGIVIGAGDRILFSSSTDAVINMSGVEIS